ncbi:thiazole synthase [Cupriavidus gilardii]|uniref:Thiazole synthase n=1 Tax=Cupriavidus gilardii TaxID=82541 RepID=A0A6N1BCB4_9BURK|nr:thiazole synthase [Cupriavidus gilardii]ALD89404.1 thiazole synthase [Cupriavidus gilardii CR3]QQE07071.1 thiazole synthase [Cupriavidus sp. ISTL7]KAB0596709.1 thiazole synthase [Cupriavidus gilardii]MCT9013639.1 thiazole synthase [Cupriavidus gilardii]MCT9051827.1 thiazole synthase [Cupriavidus gilardii]
MTFPTQDAVRDPFVLYGESFSSRLLLGTARYPSPATLQSAVEASKPAMLTVALRRQGAVGDGEGGQAFWQMLKSMQVPVLPNTAGCMAAQEAITTAMMAREVFETDWIKLELVGDDYTLQPDTLNLPAVAETLIKEGFKVLPYCTEDLVLCRRLLDAGCQALMPWAAPIGTGKGAVNPHAMRVLRDRLPDTPLIVDAGLGLPSHAAQVLEWGYDGVLLNTAVAQAAYPIEMARAFARAVEAGRLAYLAGPMPEREIAQASTPVVGMPFWHAQEHA